jgi:type II secretory pathway component GspD/PulD (secretin)
MLAFGKTSICTAALLTLALTAGASHAEPSADPAGAVMDVLKETAPEAIRVVEMPTDDVVRLVAKQFGLVPHISDRVRGRVSNVRLEGDLGQMMASIAADSDIEWFVYEGGLEVSTNDETITRFVPLKGLAFEDAQRVLNDASLDTTRFGIQPIANGGAVRVSGPPKAVEVVEALFALTTAADKPIPATKAIVVRRGTSKGVETYGVAAVAQLVADRKAGALNPPDPELVANETAAAEAGPATEEADQPTQ